MLDYSLLQFDDNCTLTVPYKHAFTIPVLETIGPIGIRPVRGFLRATWLYTLPVSAIYIVSLFVIQRWMRNRPAFCLRRPLIFWNFSLALFSIVGFVRSFEEIVGVLRNYGFYHSICYAYELHGITEFWAVLFAGSKLVELGDSYFIVLRKRPLIFLHWFHHAAVLIYTVHGGAEHTASGRWFISVNYFIHALMYTYYAMSALQRRLPRWVSIAITSAQIAQMFVGLWLCSQVLKMKNKGKECKQSDGDLFLCLSMYTAFALLFINYFVKTYFRSDKNNNLAKKML